MIGPCNYCDLPNGVQWTCVDGHIDQVCKECYEYRANDFIQKYNSLPRKLRNILKPKGNKNNSNAQKYFDKLRLPKFELRWCYQCMDLANIPQVLPNLARKVKNSLTNNTMLSKNMKQSNKDAASKINGGKKYHTSVSEKIKKPKRRITLEDSSGEVMHDYINQPSTTLTYSSKPSKSRNDENKNNIGGSHLKMDSNNISNASLNKVSEPTKKKQMQNKCHCCYPLMGSQPGFWYVCNGGHNYYLCNKCYKWFLNKFKVGEGNTYNKEDFVAFNTMNKLLIVPPNVDMLKDTKYCNPATWCLQCITAKNGGGRYHPNFKHNYNTASKIMPLIPSLLPSSTSYIMKDDNNRESMDAKVEEATKLKAVTRCASPILRGSKEWHGRTSKSPVSFFGEWHGKSNLNRMNTTTNNNTIDGKKNNDESNYDHQRLVLKNDSPTPLTLPVPSGIKKIGKITINLDDLYIKGENEINKHIELRKKQKIHRFRTEMNVTRNYKKIMLDQLIQLSFKKRLKHSLDEKKRTRSTSRVQKNLDGKIICTFVNDINDINSTNTTTCGVTKLNNKYHEQSRESPLTRMPYFVTPTKLAMGVISRNDIPITLIHEVKRLNVRGDLVLLKKIAVGHVIELEYISSNNIWGGGCKFLKLCVDCSFLFSSFHH